MSLLELKDVSKIYGDLHALDKANLIRAGKDVMFVACGEMVFACVRAAELLCGQGIDAGVLDMYCVKPLDEESLLEAAVGTRLLVTVEEHDIFGGLGSLVSSVICREHPMRVLQLALPDEHLVGGTDKEIFRHYGLDPESIAKKAAEWLRQYC